MLPSGSNCFIKYSPLQKCIRDHWYLLSHQYQFITRTWSHNFFVGSVKHILTSWTSSFSPFLEGGFPPSGTPSPGSFVPSKTTSRGRASPKKRTLVRTCDSFASQNCTAEIWRANLGFEVVRIRHQPADSSNDDQRSFWEESRCCCSIWGDEVLRFL